MGTQIIWLQIQISIAVLAVLLLRGAMKKMPKIYAYLLWVLVFARLLCPMSIESRFSFMPSLQERQVWAERALERVSGNDAPDNMTEDDSFENDGALSGNGTQSEGALSHSGAGFENESLSGDGTWFENGVSPDETSQQGGTIPGTLAGGAEVEDETSKAGSGMKWILVLVWGTGMFTILGYNAAALGRLRKKLRTARPLDEEVIQKGLSVADGFVGKKSASVYSCEGIGAPFALGLVRPKIYLPANLAEEELAYILTHEQVHIRRKDYLVKNLAFLLTAIYWFNPFVWVAFFFLERDMEMSCDEKVIKLMGSDIKRNYSQSLLNFAVGRGGMALTPLTFGENNVKQRVRNVLTYRNAKKWSVAVGSVLLLVGAILMFTTGEGKETNKENSQTVAGVENVTGNDEKTDIEGEKGTAEGNGTENVAEIFWTSEVTLGEGEDAVTVTVQARENGIYRMEDGLEECIYPYHIPFDSPWDIYEGVVYLFTDTTYREGDLACIFDGIAMIDIKSGQFDTQTLRTLDMTNAIGTVNDIEVGYGYIVLHDSDKKKSYHISLLNTGETALTGNYFQGEAVSELDEEKQDLYGTLVREQILSEAQSKSERQMIKLSNRKLKETFAIVDLDGDGDAERITLSRNPEPLTDLYWTYGSFDKFKLDVDGSSITGEILGMDNDIYAFSLDGKNIILALSAAHDTELTQTVLYSYTGGELKELGVLPCCAGHLILKDGYFEGWMRSEEFMQPCWILKKWCINKEGQLEEILQDSYALHYSKNKLPRLLVALPVHDTPGGEEIHYIQPQNVDFVRINDDFLWIYLEAEDGSSGWFQVETNLVVQEGATVRTTDIVELDMDQTEVFELFYAG